MIQGTKIYRVTVSGGKIDNYKICDYKDFDVSKLSTSDKETCLEKARARVRFERLCLDLQRGLDFMNDFDNTQEDGSYKVVPSSLSFTLSYTQPDGLFVEVKKDDADYVESGDDVEKLRSGRIIFKGAKALEKIIKDSLKAEYKIITEFYDCTEVATKSGTELRAWSLNYLDITGTDCSVSIKEILPYKE